MTDDHLTPEDRALLRDVATLATSSNVMDHLAQSLAARIRELSREIAEHKAVCDAFPLAVALAQAKDQLAAAEADADRLAEALQPLSVIKGALDEAGLDFIEIGGARFTKHLSSAAIEALTAHQARKEGK